MPVYEKLSSENLSQAKLIHQKIFPDESDIDTLEYSLSNHFIQGKICSCDFWLVKVDGKYAGITGLYAYENNHDDVWMNWFGVLPEYRRRHLGLNIFMWTIKKARKSGYKNFRLYTAKGINNDAICFYRKLGMIEENYRTEEPEICDILIFSKSLSRFKHSVEKWDNKPLYIHETMLLCATNPLLLMKQSHYKLWTLFCSDRRNFFRLIRKIIKLKIKKLF